MNKLRGIIKARPSNMEAAEQSDGKIHYSRSNGKFKMNQTTTALSQIIKLKRKARKAKNKVKTKQKLMWGQFMSARDSGGGGFNQGTWLQDHHDKKGRAARKRRKKEERKKRKRNDTPVLPKLKEVVLEETTMTPFKKDNRKRPFPKNLLPLPTPMGKKNFAEMMGRYETYELGMQALHEKTVARSVSKDFLVFVLTQEKRQREAAKRSAVQAVENDLILKRALARLKNKQLAGAFHTWEEMWDTMKRMRSLMQRIAGGSKSAVFARWVEFRKICIQERMTAYDNLAEYAIVIQAWIRMFQAIEYVDRYKIETNAAKVIQRMVRAWHARNILTKAKAHQGKVEALLRRVRNRMFFAVQHRIFDAWSEWASSIAALKRFVKKHMLGGVTKAFHTWIEGIKIQQEEQNTADKLRKFMHKNMLGGVRKGFLAWVDALKNIKLLRQVKNKMVHGKIHRIWVAWSEYCSVQKRIKKFMNRWKNAEIHQAFDTWHEEAHRAVRIRHLARKLFLGALEKSFHGWKLLWSNTVRSKNVAARSIQGLYHIFYGKTFLKRAKQQIRDDELAELAKLKAAGKDTERHRLMKIDADDPVVTKRLELLHTELKDAMESSTGFFDSKSLHDQFDLHQQGTYVMSSLRKELVNETCRLVQHRSNKDWYDKIAAEESQKWGATWERNHKFGPEEQIRRDLLDVHTLHDHFPEEGMPTAGKSIVFQGTFQNFEDGLRDSLKEWSFMEAQGWISHKQYIQWIVRGAITNVNDPNKKLVGWNLLKELCDENTFAEVAVVLGNNELIDKLGGQHMAIHYLNDAVHT
tara:strand:- start:168 stop:2585 length:2418 start_codon:yes stop_codon:yes gene_type:complete